MRLLLFFLPVFTSLGLCAQSSEMDSLIYHELQFDLDDDGLTRQERDRLDSLIDILPRPALRQIFIYGHTDSIADSSYNIALSKRRVQSVLKHLVRRGFDPMLVQTDYYGKERPRYENTPDEYYKNRRVELTLVLDRALIPEAEQRLGDFRFAKGEKVRIPNLVFVGNQAIPNWESFAVMQELLQVMQRYPDLKIELQGHVCCSNDEQLSVERARMVYFYLKENGIDQSRLSYKGFSNKQPLYREIDEKSRALNRRVEILVLSNSNRQEDRQNAGAARVSLTAPVLNLHFPKNSARLAPAGDFMLTLIAEMLKTSEGLFYQFVVYNNIDNQQLSAQRANSIQRTLRRKGVPVRTFSVKSENAPPWMASRANNNSVMVKILNR